jgi:hypothetical protein
VPCAAKRLRLKGIQGRSEAGHRHARTLVGREEETELLRRVTVCRSEIVGGIGDYRTFVQGYLVAIFVEYAATTTGLVVGDVAGGQR